GRLGSLLFAFDYATLGPTLSLRSFARLGSSLSCANTLWAPNTVRFTSNTYMYYDSATPLLHWYMNGAQVMSMSNTGGQLHGTWTESGTWVTSDRRLKKDVKPLTRTLRDFLKPQVEEAESTQMALQASTQEKKGEDAGALWVLRQLRPVSYYFKKGSESKYMRFGFIADELESVVPQVVRHKRGTDYSDEKAVAYTDLIALLTSAAQGQQQVIERQQDRMDKLLSDFAQLKTELVTMKQEEIESEPPRKSLRGEKKKKRSGKGKAKEKLATVTANTTNTTNATNTSGSA
ncbi:unnamed protein product, partial [Effrenium voratum]